jgi:hypothetical protein
MQRTILETNLGFEGSICHNTLWGRAAIKNTFTPWQLVVLGNRLQEVEQKAPQIRW